VKLVNLQTLISDANPQQKNYNWGTNQLVKWTSLEGKEITGMLVKPENFDPSKKYPMIVNFYEKSSDRLHRHIAPSPGRSTINYSFYTSRGYVIFNPDVHYKIGYPGESAYNCVIPGIETLLKKGFIDKDNIGVQGHSWGGYQIAHLVTKTNIFKAAESGAPVVNMISAYGGIRWWTGLSRQFQYEHTQSRIGGTPWEYPQRYLENSPIFNLDKVNTPLLIMHNDADGHVPWYQGIEFFVGLRRLGKPSWLLNYNGEPHWPLKHQNRKDFNIRLAQFFDYYLKGAKKPIWMQRGVPAIEKGINQGYELIDEKK
jgi:dipeptidyl aminopeptidase/acylaminoacyl peptidase